MSDTERINTLVNIGINMEEEVADLKSRLASALARADAFKAEADQLRRENGRLRERIRLCSGSRGES